MEGGIGYSESPWESVRTPTGETYDRALHSLKAIADKLAGGGSKLGVFNVPTMEHERGIFWFKPVGTGDADGTTAANAATGAYDSITTYGTANQDDIFYFLQGAYDFDGAVGGLAFVLRTSVYGLGVGATVVENSNVAATAVMTVTVAYVEIAGFNVNENTNTVEGIVASANLVYIHHNYIDGTMENGIGIQGSNSAVVEWNTISGGIVNDGIEVSGIPPFCIIRHNIITNCGDNGINLNGNNVNGAIVYKNHINGNSGTTDTGINVVLGDEHHIVENTIGECGTALWTDTGGNNVWEDNKGTLETDWTTALDNSEQDVYGTAAAPMGPLNESGKVRIYPDYVNLGAGDTVVIRVYRRNDGTNLRLATSWTITGAQANDCPMYEIHYTKTRTVRITIQRTAGAIDVPIGIAEDVR